MSKVKRHSLQTGLIEGVEYVLASDHEAEVAALKEQLRTERATQARLITAHQAEVAALRERMDEAERLLRIATVAPGGAVICCCRGTAEHVRGACWYCETRRFISNSARNE